MVKRPGLTFKRRACGRCGGDAYLEPASDDKEWRCLQCGRLVLPEGVAVQQRLAPAPIPARTRWD
jgi:ribosomal protein S27AE